jgi:hypothetical protein
LSGVLRVARVRKLYRNPLRFDRVFLALVQSGVGVLLEFYEFQQRTDSRVPMVYPDSRLLGYLRHYLGVGDLPIIVNHSLASLMLFVPLHNV